MLTHAHRHLPCTQRPHTRRFPHTPSLTPTPCLTHIHHTTHTRGGTHPRCLSHTPCLTPTRLFAYACRFLRARGLFHLGAPFTHGVLGSMHSGTLANTPLTHGVSLALGVSVAHGVSLIHGGALTLVAPRTQRLSPALCVRCSMHFAMLVYTHVDTTHTGTLALGTITPGTRATTRGSGVSIPPKLRVHPFAALVPSTSQGTTEPTWS